MTLGSSSGVNLTFRVKVTSTWSLPVTFGLKFSNLSNSLKLYSNPVISCIYCNLVILLYCLLWTVLGLLLGVNLTSRVKVTSPWLLPLYLGLSLYCQYITVTLVVHEIVQ